MELSQFFPIWNQLSPADQELLKNSAVRQTVKKGTLLHNGEEDCLGLMAIISGQLRAFILSEDGREVTLYRLFEYDICLFSASCMMQNIHFSISIETEKDSELWIIPAYIYKKVTEQSLAFSNYTNQLMSSRFSDVMWLMEQIMWKSMDKRLAAFLLEESSLEETEVLKITHEKIANHMGTAREVVTRMLRYFQAEDMVHLTRGTIELTNLKLLQELSES